MGSENQTLAEAVYKQATDPLRAGLQQKANEQDVRDALTRMRMKAEETRRKAADLNAKQTGSPPVPSDDAIPPQLTDPNSSRSQGLLGDIASQVSGGAAVQSGGAQTRTGPGPQPGTLATTQTGRVPIIPNVGGRAGLAQGVVTAIGQQFNPNFGTRQVTNTSTTLDQRLLDDEAGRIVMAHDEFQRTGDPSAVQRVARDSSRFSPRIQQVLGQKAKVQQARSQQERRTFAITEARRLSTAGANNPVQLKAVTDAIMTGSISDINHAYVKVETESDRREQRSVTARREDVGFKRRAELRDIATQNRLQEAADASIRNDNQKRLKDNIAYRQEIRSQGLMGSAGLVPGKNTPSADQALSQWNKIAGDGDINDNELGTAGLVAMDYMIATGGQWALWADDNWFSETQTRDLGPFWADTAVVSGMVPFDKNGKIIRERDRLGETDINVTQGAAKEAAGRLRNDWGVNIELETDESTGLATYFFNQRQPTLEGSRNTPWIAHALRVHERREQVFAETGTIPTSPLDYDNEQRAAAGLRPLQVSPGRKVQFRADGPVIGPLELPTAPTEQGVAAGRRTREVVKGVIPTPEERAATIKASGERAAAQREKVSGFMRGLFLGR